MTAPPCVPVDLPSCRVCGRANEAVTHSRLTPALPKDGDATLCWYCGEVSIFVAGPLGLALREPTTAELADVHRRHAPLLRALAQHRARKAGEGR